MEGMFSFVGIIIIVFGVLQIILFFKMWGMTNDVSEMKNMMELFLRKDFQNNTNLEKEEAFAHNTHLHSKNITIGESVIYKKTNQEFIVMRQVSNDLFDCSSLDNKEHYILNVSDLYKS